MKTIQMVLASVLMLNSAVALAVDGNGAGNGGGMHYCPAKQIQDFYDVYEGRTRYRLSIPSSGFTVPEETIINNAITKLEKENVTFAAAVKEQIAHLASPDNFTLDDLVKLLLVPDANLLRVDEGCEYRQLANWDDATNWVTVKKSLYEEMDTFGQAALKLHEAIYKAARLRNKAPNSDQVRRLVAELLSNLPKTTVSGSFKLAWDMVAGPEAPGFEMNHWDVWELNLGKINSLGRSNYGTLTVSIREWKEFARQKKELEKKLTDLSLSGKARREIEGRLSEIAERTSHNKVYGLNLRKASKAGTKLGQYEVATLVTGESMSFDVDLATTETVPVTYDFEFVRYDGVKFSGSTYSEVVATIPGSYFGRSTDRSLNIRVTAAVE